MQQQSKLNGKRSWVKEEDDMLLLQISRTQGKQNWETVARRSGNQQLQRSANSCRLRWLNHLKPGSRPNCKLTDEEKLLILEFRSLWGGRNCWSKIAKRLLPGRRDNDVKNFWHSLAKKAKREGRDADDDAFQKRVELMETIRTAGRFTADYSSSSSICPVAYDKLKELLPDLPGGGAGIGALSSADSRCPGCSVVGPNSSNQVPGAAFDSASTETSNPQGCYHMQVTTSSVCNTVLDAPQVLAPVEQPKFNTDLFFDLHLNGFDLGLAAYELDL